MMPVRSTGDAPKHSARGCRCLQLIPPHRVQDIDTLEDWEHAERLYAALQIANSPQAHI
jgi:hypothetical protein